MSRTGSSQQSGSQRRNAQQNAQQRAQRWAQRLVERVNPADADRIAKAMLKSIDQVSGTRWDAAVARAGDLPGAVRPEKIKALTNSFARELAAAGATAGVAAATPVVGTTATMLAATAELAGLAT
jgi:hypothetical protein